MKDVRRRKAGSTLTQGDFTPAARISRLWVGPMIVHRSRQTSSFALRTRNAKDASSSPAPIRPRAPQSTCDGADVGSTYSLDRGSTKSMASRQAHAPCHTNSTTLIVPSTAGKLFMQATRGGSRGGDTFHVRGRPRRIWCGPHWNSRTTSSASVDVGAVLALGLSGWVRSLGRGQGGKGTYHKTPPPCPRGSPQHRTWPTWSLSRYGHFALGESRSRQPDAKICAWGFPRQPLESWTNLRSHPPPPRARAARRVGADARREARICAPGGAPGNPENPPPPPPPPRAAHPPTRAAQSLLSPPSPNAYR
eukprot:gene8894-biopygen1633